MAPGQHLYKVSWLSETTLESQLAFLPVSPTGTWCNTHWKPGQAQTGLSLPTKGNEETTEHPHKLLPTFCSLWQLRDHLNLLCKGSCKPGTAQSNSSSEAEGSLAVVARPTFEPAADGDQASCMTATGTTEAGSGARCASNCSQNHSSERWNVTKTRRWETGQRKTQQWRTERASKPEVEPRWNGASAKTREKGLPVLRVAACERTNLSSREKRKQTPWFLLAKNTQKKCTVYRRCEFD